MKESNRERQVNAAEMLAGAAWSQARRPVPYVDEPSYVEGRLDYFEGVDYLAYASGASRLWRLGFLEAKADYPSYHND